MPVTVKINGVDKTSYVDWRTLSVEQVIDSQVDSCSFVVPYDGVGKTLIPALNDVIEVLDGVTTVFAGVVVTVTQQIQSRSLILYEVKCASYERLFDRYLVADTYDGKSGHFVINSILNDFVNVVSKVLTTMEAAESWTDEAGTSAADTDDYVYGAQARKITLGAAATYTGRTEKSLDMTVMDDGAASDTSDIITLAVRATTGENVASVRLRFCEETGGAYTNYFEYTSSAVLRTGWNQISFAKSACSETGTPSWASIESVQVQVVTGAGGGATVTIDDLRLIPSDGFTQGNVRGLDDTIDFASFNYEPVFDVLTQLAENLGMSWYVDGDRDLNMYPHGVVSAPFSLTDDSANFFWESLTVIDDISQIRNQIIVRGGEEVGSTLNEDVSHQADGTNKIFKLGYKYSNISVEVDAAVQTVGVDNIDDPASFDCLYNYSEKVIKFTAAPADGSAITVAGDPHIPIIIKKSDRDSIAEFGVFEHIVVDRNITTREAARERAQAELLAYRAAMNEGSFQTSTAGLRAGQQINITSTTRSIDVDYIINGLRMTLRTPTEALYSARLVSTKHDGIIEFLISLLRNDAKKISINEDEVVDLVETFEEEITLTETVTVETAYEFAETVTLGEAIYAAVDAPPTWVAGPYNPTAILPTDPKRPMFADRGAAAT